MGPLCGSYETVANKPKASEPGNYGHGWQGITGQSMEDPAKRSRCLNSDLANGRLVRVEIMGRMFQSNTFGTTGPQIWLSGSAFESELGAQALVGSWDPVPSGGTGEVP